MTEPMSHVRVLPTKLEATEASIHARHGFEQSLLRRGEGMVEEHCTKWWPLAHDRNDQHIVIRGEPDADVG